MKEFILEDTDFNQLSIISSLSKPIAQLVDGKAVWVTPRQLASFFWERICMKYKFHPGNVQTNLTNRDARYFMAEPIPEGSLLNWCFICKKFDGPDHSTGCEKSNKPGCSWYVDKK